jgi:hypothetical protein
MLKAESCQLTPGSQPGATDICLLQGESIVFWIAPGKSED